MEKRILLLVACAFVSLHTYAQLKVEYLQKNRFDVSSTNFDFPQKDFKIIGFGAYHGSAKTEQAELALLKSLSQNRTIKYYLPETDFSIGYYFNKYLANGDTLLLKDLVTQYGDRVPQERTIEVYNKWKELKKLNDGLANKNKLKVVGIDFQVNYKYAAKHILELITDRRKQFAPIQEIGKMMELDTANYALDSAGYACIVLKKLVHDYENNKNHYKKHIKNKVAFQHIVNNLKISFDENGEREKTIFNNYLALDSVYDFKRNPQFLRMGFSHIEKSREGKKGYPYFFTRLIENKVYANNEILSAIGFFTKSEVVWDELYDEKGNYSGFTVEGGYGIGDYDKEYFRGIQNLKDTKIADITLFRLNKKQTPYANNEPDLIEVVMQDEKSNGEAVKGMPTTHFMDYAVLISNSKASTPIYEMK